MAKTEQIGKFNKQGKPEGNGNGIMKTANC